MPRKTSLSVEELLDEMNSPMCRKCFVVNEIGVACHEGEDKDGKGEKSLVIFLNDGDPGVFLPAYCYLATSEEMAVRNAKELERWRKKPENEQYLAWVDKKITENTQ